MRFTGKLCRTFISNHTLFKLLFPPLPVSFGGKLVLGPSSWVITGRLSSVLGAWICWKSPNPNNFDINRSQNFNINLSLNNQTTNLQNTTLHSVMSIFINLTLVPVFWRSSITLLYSILSTRSAAKFEMVPSNSLSPLWVSMCLFRSLSRPNDLWSID